MVGRFYKKNAATSGYQLVLDIEENAKLPDYIEARLCESGFTIVIRKTTGYTLTFGGNPP
jgi:hypothetical protein